MYAELHAKTNFSFLLGASHPDELVHRAAELGYAALAITDRNSLAGVVRAHVAAKHIAAEGPGLKLLIGAEVTPQDADDASSLPPVVLLATDRAAYARLCRLLTIGRRRAPKGACRLTTDDLAGHAEGLIALVDGNGDAAREEEEEAATKWKKGRNSECGMRNERQRARGEEAIRPAAARLHSDFHIPTSALSSPFSVYRDIFADRCYLLAELHHGVDDGRRLRRLEQVARAVGLPLVAAGDVHYHDPARSALHDVLLATRHGCTVAEVGRHRFSNAQRHLRAPEEIAALFAGLPEAVARTREVADRCQFSLDELRYEYPEELCPRGQTATAYLRQLAWDGARSRYPAGVPEKVRRLLEYELALVAELRYEAYFLTVWDLVRFARSRGILCQGRGSAANSAVCYCLGVTAVDPDRLDVLFERFVSRERNEAPDIDVDFEHERREEVLQYLYEKYGRERAGMTAEVITYRPRSAVRDVGKALNIAPEVIDRLAKSLDGRATGDVLRQRCLEAGLPPDSAEGSRLTYLTDQLIGFPRHLSQHVGGMVMTQGALCELVPIENAAMPGRTVIQWDKNDLDALGILKVDCLALGMLTAIRKCFDLIDCHEGRRLTLADIPQDDPRVYAMMQRADTIGVFQIESRAQMSMLPRLRPRCFYDLVIEVAIVRPGPIQGDMVHPYLRRRAGKEPVEYPSEAIRQVLKKTLGVPLFQEQAMRLAVVAAGFTPGEADQLRRAMGAWRRPGVIDQFQRKLIAGMLAGGLSREFAERVFAQIRGFGEYGFPESHAASFALLVYVSAWLKHYYPAAYTAALLNSQPMGFYAPAQLVRDAREHGVEVLPCEVSCSAWDHGLEKKSEVGVRNAECGTTDAAPQGSLRQPNPTQQATTSSSGLQPLTSAFRIPNSDFAIRLGFRLVRGLGRAPVARIVQARASGAFVSFADFARRTGLSRAMLRRLAQADVFSSLGLSRREALWQALAHGETALPLFADDDEPPPERLPIMSPMQEVLADYHMAGLSLRAHPMSFLRDSLTAQGMATAESLETLPTDRLVQVAGLVLLRQRPSTARGITFVTLEDETGVANLVVYQHIWERYRRAASGAAILHAHGRLERHEGVIHVVANKLEDLSRRLQELHTRSRDFR